MKITLLLIGTLKDGRPPVEHIKLTSSDGKGPMDQKKVFDYIKDNSPVQGLACKLKGDGTITYSSSNGQLRPGIVADMGAVFRDALNQI